MNQTTEPRYINGGRRLAYDPELHPNHKKPWTTRELAYLAYHYEGTHKETLALDLGRTHSTVLERKNTLKRQGNFEEMKRIYEERFLCVDDVGRDN